MAPRRESDEAALADRLINYSDALVAVSFLSVSGIGIAVADPDIRCTIAEGASHIMAGNIGNGVVFTALILLFRRWERVLRADDPPSETVARYARWIHVGRLAILWTSVIAASFLAFQAVGDECESGASGLSDGAGMDRSSLVELALVSEGGSCSVGS